MMKRTIAIFLFCLFGFIGCGNEAGLTEQKLLQYLNLADDDITTLEKLKVAVRQKYPDGTSRKRIQETLQRNEVKADQRVKIYERENPTQIISRFYRGSQQFVGREDVITFTFDGNEQLKEITLETQLTGL